MYPLSLPTLSVVLVSFYLVLHVILAELRRARLSSSLVHGPPSYPILGCLISFYKNRSRLLDWYTDLLSESRTKTIVISRFGARRTIVTTNPQNVEYILKTNFTNFPKGKSFTGILGDFLGKGIFNVDGDLWYCQRKLTSHELTARSFRDYVLSVLKEEVDKKLLPKMESLAQQNGKEVDLQDLLRRIGFDIICRITLGVDPCAFQNSPPVSSIMEAFDKASEISAKRGAAPVSAIWKAKRLLGLGSEKALQDSIQQIHSFVTNVIRDKRRKSLKGEACILGGEDFLLKMVAAGNSKEEVLTRDMIISLIMAGRDTTSAAMTWFFYLLSGHPDTEQELVKELVGLAVEGDELSCCDTLRELRLLKACLCESMRLYPPVAWDSKHAITDDMLPDGTPVCAGDRITYFPYGMGRAEDLWGKDRSEFRPERWVLERDGKGIVRALRNVSPYKFPVFQAGPRVCLGKDLAFIQMKYIAASMLKLFEIRPASSGRPVFVPFLTAHMAGGFKVFVRRRQIMSPDENG